MLAFAAGRWGIVMRGVRISRAVGLGVTAATLFAVAPAIAQGQQQVTWCVNKDGAFAPDLVIQSCTATIQSGSYKGKEAAWALYNRGNAYWAKGDAERAIADYNEVIRLDPSYSHAYGNRGLVYRAKGDLDRAIADYSKAIETGSDEVKLDYNNRGFAYGAKNDQDRAIADFNEAIRLDPKFAIAYNNRGIAYRAKGQIDRAIAEYSEAIRLNPKYAEAFYNRGIAHRVKGDFDRSIADYGEAVRIEPKYVLAFNNRGNAFLAKGDFDRAIADYTEALRLDPKLILGFTNRANAYDIKGDERAIADHAETIRLEPDNIERYKSRGYSYFYAANYSAAASDLARAVPQSPGDPYPVLWLYLTRVRLNAPNAAAELELHAGKLKPSEWPFAAVELFLGRRAPDAVLAAAGKPEERCEAQFYVGMWHLLRNELAAAVAPLKVAADTCPDGYMEYRGARAELKRLGAR